MRGALDEVALIEVVGLYSAEEELVEEGGLYGQAVVDSAQEDGLIAKLYAGFA